MKVLYHDLSRFIPPYPMRASVLTPPYEGLNPLYLNEGLNWFIPLYHMRDSAFPTHEGFNTHPPYPMRASVLSIPVRVTIDSPLLTPMRASLFTPPYTIKASVYSPFPTLMRASLLTPPYRIKASEYSPLPTYQGLSIFTLLYQYEGLITHPSLPLWGPQ